MKPIAEMTKGVLDLMKPHQLWPWENWARRIMGNGSLPARKTYGYELFIRERLEAKASINKELERMKRPERLFCAGPGEGVYLVNEIDVADLVIGKSVIKIIRSFETGHKRTRNLAGCERISAEDRRMLNRVSVLVELQNNTMIGTIARMKSLPPATKKRLLKKLGFKAEK